MATVPSLPAGLLKPNSQGITMRYNLNNYGRDPDTTRAIDAFGGLAKAQAALDNYNKQYLLYNLDSALESNSYSRAADAARSIANSSLFSSADRKKYGDLATDYGDEATRIEEEKAAARAARDAQNARTAAAHAAKAPLLEASFARRNTAINTLDETRGSIYDKIIADAQADRDRVNTAYDNGQISDKQRQDLWNSIEATRDSNLKTLDSQWKSARAAVYQQQEQVDEPYLNQIFQDISSGAKTGQENFVLPKFTTPSISQNTTYTPIEMPEFVAGEAVRETEPAVSRFNEDGTPKTIQEYIGDLREAALARIDANMAEGRELLTNFPEATMPETAQVNTELNDDLDAINYWNQRESLPSVMTAKQANDAVTQALADYGLTISEVDPNALDILTNFYEKAGAEEARDWFESNVAPSISGFLEPGESGLTRTQSRELAKLISFTTGVSTFTDDEGNVLQNPLDTLANEIYTNGYEGILNKITEQGAGVSVPPTYIDRTVAEDFAKQMLEGNNFNLTHLDAWANTVQNVGFEEAAKRFKNANGRETVFLNPTPSYSGDETIQTSTTEALQPFIDRNTTAIAAIETGTKEFLDNNIQRILNGETVLPSVPSGLTPREALDQASQARGIDYSSNPEAYQNWLDYFEKWGSDVGVSRFNLLYNPADLQGVDVELFAPRDQVFGTTTPEQPLLDRGEPTLGITGAPQLPGQSTELGIPVERGEVTPAAGLSAITSAYPTTLPTTGVPTSGVPAGFQTSTYQPAPYTPPPLIAQAPARPTLTPTQELIGAPGVGRPVGAPMQALTPEQAGARFVPPTQEDYYAFFGYTPEQLNAAQYLAELEGAPRAGIAAQTVPTLPPAVTGAPTEMKKGGMPQDAQRLASKGRGGDSTLVHMAPEEVAGLQALARQNGTSLTINPETGLPEALSLKKLLPAVVTLGAAAFGVPIPVGAMLYGAGTAIGSGSIEKGIAAGLSAYGGANLASAAYTGATGNVLPGFEAAPATGSVATNFGGVSADAAMDAAGTLEMNQPSFLDTVISKLSGPATVPSSVNSLYMKGALPLTTGMGLQEGAEQRDAYNNYMDKVAADSEKRRRESQQLFASTLGSVPLQYARKGGLMQLAGGGMTYAEGGGTTGPTNEPRMVKGTGDGMSDSVPATIEGVQEARLANDEFVIPADVVADLGNGSSSAGAQQLYDMMDRVRQARHGTTEQPPEIDVRKLMPA